MQGQYCVIMKYTAVFYIFTNIEIRGNLLSFGNWDFQEMVQLKDKRQNIYILKIP